MINVVDPKVTVVGFGPNLTFKKGEIAIIEGKEVELEKDLIITPDELVYGASRITYKDTGVFSELIEKKLKGEDLKKKSKKGLVNTAGRGHASLATTPGLWVFLEENSSKMVDAMFTGARFGSFLMPSGRRIPIRKDQVLVPRSILESDRAAIDIYLHNSLGNIEAYELLQESGIPKQDASKIVQYGHRGGGFDFLPLETIINYAVEFERNPGLIPTEGIEVIAQLENFIKENGMGITYEARKNAPRTGCPNPSIFHDRVNEAKIIIDENRNGVLHSPILLGEPRDMKYPFRENMLHDVLNEKKFMFKEVEGYLILEFGERILNRLDDLVADFNNSISVSTATNSPLRVWGEVKRHRTLPQTVESVYHAIERSLNVIGKSESLNDEDLVRVYHEVVSIPDSVKKNEKALKLWLERFSSSVLGYKKLIRRGIPKGDAVSIIPRGQKVGVVKTFDMYNLLLGYFSLRLCSTAEPEMRTTTEQERELVRKTNISQEIKDLMIPKCGYIGYCPESQYCGNVMNVSPWYNKKSHSAISKIINMSFEKILGLC